jgi:spoIIIJ-associated protein
MITKGKFEILADAKDSSISLNVSGEDAGILIGKNGQTLDALQYVLNRMVNKHLEKKVLIVVDIENYRKRKREGLIELAKKMGERAKKTRKPVSTNLLNARDRRVIHLALKDDRELETKSRGEGLLKKVVIYPKPRNSQRNTGRSRSN